MCTTSALGFDTTLTPGVELALTSEMVYASPVLIDTGTVRVSEATATMPRQNEESKRRHRHGRQFTAATHFFSYRCHFDHRPILPHYGTSIVLEFGPEKNGLFSGVPAKPTALGACVRAPCACVSRRLSVVEATRPAGGAMPAGDPRPARGVRTAGSVAGSCAVRFSIPAVSKLWASELGSADLGSAEPTISWSRPSVLRAPRPCTK